MSIQTDLTRIKNAKAVIKAYIEGKGLTVPEGTLLDGMASMLESIEAGGGNFSVETGSITFAESYKPNSTPLVISHSLGKTPFAFIAYNGASARYPRYQIAYLYKLSAPHTVSSRAMRSKHSTIMHSNNAGEATIVSSSGLEVIELSSDVITISGGSSVADFHPDMSGSYSSTLVWFAIAEN